VGKAKDINFADFRSISTSPVKGKGEISHLRGELAGHVLVVETCKADRRCVCSAQFCHCLYFVTQNANGTANKLSSI
jgi:hypothetical protein